MQAAIHERIVKCQKPCTMEKEDFKRMGAFINTALGLGKHKNADYTVFSKEKVAKVMQEIYSLGQVKSKKWSQSRFDAAFEKLMRKYNPKFVLQAKVKVERCCMHPLLHSIPMCFAPTVIGTPNCFSELTCLSVWICLISRLMTMNRDSCCF